MHSGFKTDTLSLGQLLSDPFEFRIPDYQRTYSWTIKEVEQLVEDLSLALGESTSLDDPEVGYFLGAVLLMKQLDDGPKSDSASDSPPSRIYDIVDGQQRLVTLTILLAVLRDLAADTGVELAPDVNRLIWTISAEKSEPRIRLRTREGEFLRSHVQRAGASVSMPSDDELTAGETRILAVREHLAATFFGQTGAEVATFAKFLIDACFFAVITTTTVDRAHRIFSVLNERGRPLARNDILKAQILGGIDPARRKRHTEAWDRIERDLGGDFESLFSHIRTIEDGGRSKVISGIADLIAASGGAEPFFDKVLEPYAAIFRQLTYPAKSAALKPATLQTFTYLGWLGSADWTPAALAFWRTCNGDPVALDAFFIRLDRLAYSLRLLGIGADKRRARFHSLVRAIKKNPKLDETDNPIELTRDELRNIQYNLRNLHARSQLTCKLVLLRVNDLTAGEPQALDPANYTVEHVLPQKPARSSEWRTWYPAADEREACTQSLGNLVLVTRDDNDRARNMELSRKLAVYFPRGPEAATAITRELFAITEWRAPQIIEREQRILASVNMLWRLETARSRNSADPK